MGAGRTLQIVGAGTEDRKSVVSSDLVVVPCLVHNMSEASVGDFLGVVGLLFGFAWALGERYRLLALEQKIGRASCLPIWSLFHASYTTCLKHRWATSSESSGFCSASHGRWENATDCWRWNRRSEERRVFRSGRCSMPRTQHV